MNILSSILICCKAQITTISFINFAMEEHLRKSCKEKDNYPKRRLFFSQSKSSKLSKYSPNIISCIEISNLITFFFITELSNLPILDSVRHSKIKMALLKLCLDHPFIWLLKCLKDNPTPWKQISGQWESFCTKCYMEDILLNPKQLLNSSNNSNSWMFASQHTQEYQNSHNNCWKECLLKNQQKG